ncbi:RhoGAP domain containing protein [Entamoeba marina]
MGNSKSKKINYNNIKLSQDCIDLTSTNITNQFNLVNPEASKIKYKIDNYSTNDYDIVYNPSTGSLSPNSNKNISVTVKFKQNVNATLPVTIHIADKSELFLTVKIRGEDGVFGVEPENLDWVDYNGISLPRPLAVLDENFKRLDGHHSEGVFRLAGEVGMMKEMKTAMNQSKGLLKIDREFTINEVATLIKVWFRELPTTSLNYLSSEQIQNESINECVTSFQSLPKNVFSLLDWLFKLLVEVSKYKDQNKMTLQNLAIVVAPNLFQSTSPDPMEGLMMSQKLSTSFKMFLFITKMKYANEAIPFVLSL